MKGINCLMERDETFKNGKRYEDWDFHLALEGGLGWVKSLKNGVGQGFISHAIFLHYILFGENFIG